MTAEFILLFPSDGSGEGDDGGGGGRSGLRGQVLLLKTDACHLAPHLVHLHTLSEGFSLVIVSEVFLSNFFSKKVWFLVGHSYKVAKFSTVNELPECHGLSGANVVPPN